MSNGGNDDEKTRVYNIVLEQNKLLNRIAPFLERLSLDQAKTATALFDFLPMVENKHDYLINEQRIHKSEVKDIIEKFLTASAANQHAFTQNVEGAMKTFVDHVVAIRTATALAADNAGDAKDAANNAAAKAAEASGVHKNQRGEEGRKRPRQATPDNVVGLARTLVKGLPAWARFILALVILLGVLFGGQAIEARWQLLGGSPAREQRRERRALFEATEKDTAKPKPTTE